MFKVAPYWFLKSGFKAKFHPQKLSLNITEENKTKAICIE